MSEAQQSTVRLYWVRDNLANVMNFVMNNAPGILLTRLANGKIILKIKFLPVRKGFLVNFDIE